MDNSTAWSVAARLHCEVVDESTLAYDLSSDVVFCVEGDAHRVLQAAHGSTVSDIASELALPVNRVAGLLVDLVDRGLVETQATEPAIARRSLASLGLGAVGAAAIWAIDAPLAAATGIE